MYSIPQNYTKLLKKIIKETINKKLVLEGFNDYIHMISSINVKMSALIREALVYYFELIDRKFKNSKNRKLNYYYKDTYVLGNENYNT